MTKKHFEMIAAEIKHARSGCGIQNQYGIDALACNLAAEFESINPRFDRIKFLKACGLTPDE